VHTVNIGLEDVEINTGKPMHWIYFPGNETIFHRISFPHNLSESMVPEGCCSIQAEVSESIYRPVDRENLIGETLKGLVKIGILGENDARFVSEGGSVRVAEVSTLNPAYVVYYHRHGENVQIVRNFLKSVNIGTGRQVWRMGIS